MNIACSGVCLCVMLRLFVTYLFYTLACMFACIICNIHLIALCLYLLGFGILYVHIIFIHLEEIKI